MYEYLVEHCRKNVLQDTLTDKAKEGWKLHTMFEQTANFMIILERGAESQIPTVVKTPVRKPVNIKTRDEE